MGEARWGRRVGWAEAVGDRCNIVTFLRGSGREAAVHGIRTPGLDAVDAAARLQSLECRGDAGAKPATADRDDQCIERPRLLRKLQPQRRGAESRQRTFERMHERSTLLNAQLIGERECRGTGR